MIGLEISLLTTGIIIIVSKSYNYYLKKKSNTLVKCDTIFRRYSHLPMDEALYKTEIGIKDSKIKIDDTTLSYYLLEKKIKK